MSENKSKNKWLTFVIIFVVLVILGAIGRHAQEELRKTTAPSISTPSFSLTPASTLPVIPPTGDANDKTDEPYYGTFSNRIYTNKWAGFAFALPDDFTGGMEGKEFAAESAVSNIGISISEEQSSDLILFDLDDLESYREKIESQGYTVSYSALDFITIAGIPFQRFIIESDEAGVYQWLCAKQIKNRMCSISLVSTEKSALKELVSYFDAG